MEQNAKTSWSFWQSLSKFFLTTVLGGLIVLLPISIFLIIFRFAINLLMGAISPVSNLLRFDENSSKLTADVMAIIILILVFFIIGLVIQMPKGKLFLGRLERNYLDKVPFYPTVRDTVQQFTGKEKTPFSQVVMVDLYSNDTRLLGFITDELEDDMFAIFVPTGPNPASGCVYYCKGHQIELIEARSEDAMRCIVAVGNGTRTMLENARYDREKSTKIIIETRSGEDIEASGIALES